MTGPGAYAELLAATNFSFLRGASHPSEIVARAAELGLAAIGVADRNTLAGVVRAHQAAERHGIRLLVGARLVTEEGFEAATYPVDRAAYGRLCRTLSRGKQGRTRADRLGRGPGGACRIPFAALAEAGEGQVLIAVPPPRPCPAFAARLGDLAAAWPGQVYLAGHHRHRGDERRRLGRLAELGARLGAPLVAVGDVLYHAPERRPLQDVLTCIREGCRLDEAGTRLEPHAERHLKGAAEMARLFADHPEALARTLEVAERCTFSLRELRYEYPEEPVPPGRTPQGHLEQLAWSRARWRFPEGMPDKIGKALRDELALIAELDYARYFLTINDIVEYARDQGILAQGRGSAANSVVCYCLGITAVNPTEIDLLFARFISRNRGEPPDIDVDFEHERREEVIQHIYARYGRERAAICATVIHYRPRMAIREVGKVMGLSADVTAALSDTVWGSWGDALPDRNVAQAGLDPGNPAIRQAVDLANQLVGFPRHLSQHVGGFVLTRERLDETVPIGPGGLPDRTFIEWDKDDIDAVGLLKVDVLALGMLSCLRRALDLLETHHGEAFPTLADVPGGCERVYDMLGRADSVGVFQVESRAQMSMLPRLKPRCFYDLVVEVAIVRPGPIQGDMVHPYLRRRGQAEPVTFPAPHPGHGDKDELREVLGRTYGVPLFQEQAMRIAIVAAGFSDEEADGLRRAMATFRHVGTIGEFRKRFVGGMTRRGYDEDFAARCFKQIEGFSTYGFPESHAASFALLVYVSAWIKCHHPDAFLAAILNSQPMGFYRPAQLVRDAREHGVQVLPVDVNGSDWDCTLEPAPGSPHRFGVRLGFRQVTGLAEDEMRRVVGARGNGFAGVERLSVIEGVSRGCLQRLAEADAFRSLGLDRRAALWAVRGLDERVPARRGGRPPAPMPLFASSLGDDLFREPEAPLPEMPLPEHVAEDYIATGLSLKAHPCRFFRPWLGERGVVTCAGHRALAPEVRARVAGLVLTRQMPGTAKGVVFLTLEDETGIANVILWRPVYEANRRKAMTARLLLVEGRVQRQGEVVHVLAERLADLSPHLARLRHGLEDAPAGAPGAAELRSFRSRDFH